MTTDYEQTLIELNQVIEQHPTDAKPLAQRGDTFRLIGRYEAALVDFNRAIALKPTYSWAIAHRGETFCSMAQYENALADFNRALELKPTYVWALAHRGLIYRRLKRDQEALVDLNRVLELQPDYAWALGHRAQIYIPNRQYEAALADIDRVGELDPDLIPYWHGERALLLNYMGRYEEAMASCQLGLAKDPDDYIAWYSLAVAKAYSTSLATAKSEISQAQMASRAMLAEPGERPLALYRLAGLAILEGYIDQALDYLQQAILLNEEPAELARHDPVWQAWQDEPRFRALIVENK